MKYRLGSIDLSSSVNPDQLSKTVEGLIITSSGLIALVVKMFDLPLTAEQITGNAASIGITVGVLVSAFGLIRKLVVRYTKA